MIASQARINELCEEKGMSIRKLEKKLHFSNGYINGKRKREFPNDKLSLIANELGVTTDYLTSGNGIKKSATEIGDGNDELINYIISVLKDLPIEYKIRAVNEIQSLQQEVQVQDVLKESP